MLQLSFRQRNVVAQEPINEGSPPPTLLFAMKQQRLAASQDYGINAPFSAFSDPPEVRVVSPWVHTGLGEAAQLECIVQGNPEPKVSSCYIIATSEFYVYKNKVWRLRG